MKKFLYTSFFTIIFIPMWALMLILVGYMIFIKQPIVALIELLEFEISTYKWFTRINNFMDRML